MVERRRKVEAAPTSAPSEAHGQEFRTPKIRTRGRVREVQIVVGQETYSPIDYQSFVVPALTCVVELADDDDVQDVVESGLEVLRALQKQEYERRRVSFVEQAYDAAKLAGKIIHQRDLKERANQATSLRATSV